MSATSHLPGNLAQLDRETDRLVRDVAAMDDAAVRQASRCEGWTRAHVISHVARNADGLANLAHWALTGERREQYASPESRDADIEDGSRRGAAELLADLRESAERFGALARRLPGEAEEARVEARGGRTMRGRDLVTARLREVVFHHVDLDCGFGFADAEPGFVQRAVNESVRRLGAADPQLALVLQEPGGEQVAVLGAGGQVVTGTPADLLMWLARGDGSGVNSDRPLPSLPAWG